MHPQGIYLLGNDVVLGQLQALFQRIQHYFAQNQCAPLPVCIIPSNDDLRATRRWIAQQEGLSLFENHASLKIWEDFAQSIWMAQPVVARLSQRYSEDYGQEVGSFRRFCAFDGEFESFIFCDARGQSTHGLDRLDEVLIQLQTYDVVVDDWEHLKAEPTAVLDIPFLRQELCWNEAEVRDRLHGASFFGSHAGLFGAAEREQLRRQLLEGNELRWINPLSWWNDAALFSYMTLRCSGKNQQGEFGESRSLYNFARRPSTFESMEVPMEVPALDPLVSELIHGHFFGAELMSNLPTFYPAA